MIWFVLFVYVAFGSLDYVSGQIVGKTLAVCAVLPLAFWFRKKSTTVDSL